MKIIVDNNIWISFLIGKRLSSLKLLLCNNSCDIYICDELIQEFPYRHKDKIFFVCLLFAINI
jgi:predicted nucleic acid-binding protein